MHHKLKPCRCKLQAHCKLSYQAFSGSSAGKESTCNAGDSGSIPGWGRSPGGGHGNPLQYSCLKNPLGQRSLVGYSPRGCKELDTTKEINTELWVMWCWATQDRWVIVRSSDKMWSTGRRNEIIPVFLPGEPHGQYEKAKRYDTGRCALRSEGVQYAIGEE